MGGASGLHNLGINACKCYIVQPFIWAVHQGCTNLESMLANVVSDTFIWAVHQGCTNFGLMLVNVVTDTFIWVVHQGCRNFGLMLANVVSYNHSNGRCIRVAQTWD